MNYKNIYNKLIDRAKSRDQLTDQIYEEHHILPRCMGGSDNNGNLVRLTPEEHYIAHQLLVKIYPDVSSLVFAATMMVPKRPSNKLYGWLRKKLVASLKECQAGAGNSQYNTRWVHSDSLQLSKKIAKSESLPEGWKEGRKLDFSVRMAECRFCKNSFVKTTKISFCSEKCRTYYSSKAIFIIDSNIEEMINKFKSLGSITAVLSLYGIDGRKGNSYFSSILKKHNIPVLRRRNTSPL